MQSALLVAYRFTDQVEQDIQALSAEIEAVVGNGKTVKYGHDQGNAHSTLSDHDLRRGKLIEPDDPEVGDMLEQLAACVGAGLIKLGASAMHDCVIDFGSPLSKGQNVILPGRGNEAHFNVTEAVKTASVELGIKRENGELGLKGTWGGHATVSRFLQGGTVEQAQTLRNLLSSTTALGRVRPVGIDVGTFNTTPETGFRFTPVESFSLVRE